MKKPSITAGDWSLLSPLNNHMVCDDNQHVVAVATNGNEEANAQAIAALPKLLEALEKLEAIGSGGVAMIHETGKPTWSALDEVKRITREALAAAGYTE